MLAKDVQVIARGKFDKDGNTFEFDAAEFYFGSCPLHKLMGLDETLVLKAGAGVLQRADQQVHRIALLELLVALDLGDLVLRAHRLLAGRPEIRARVVERY